MSSSDDRPGPGSGEPPPPRWDTPPQAPAWDRPPEGAPAGWGMPPGYGAPAGYGGGYGAPPQTESKAVIALVLAIASFVLFPLIPAVAALFVASAARRDIDASGGRLTGAGLVTGAKVTAWVNIALSVLLVLFIMTAFGFFFTVDGSFTGVTPDPVELTPPALPS